MMKHPSPIKTLSQTKVALAHDYFVEYGGAERVVESLSSIYPDSPIYTAFSFIEHMSGFSKEFKKKAIITSWAQSIPGIRNLYSPLRLLSVFFFRSFVLPRSTEVVISSTNMYMAKAIRAPRDAVHLCYCHTPPRSLYGYSTMMDWKKHRLIRLGGELNNFFMRLIDKWTAKNPDIFIANSEEVRARIARYYQRDSVVIYPPIRLPKTWKTTQPKTPNVLFVGRLGHSKHPDLVVQACILLGLPLTVIGTGKLESSLKEMAKGHKNIQFRGFVSDEELSKAYLESSIVVYPSEDEDFGMIPLEALSHGTPVVVHKSGGFLETIRDQLDGMFIEDLTVESCAQLIQKALKHQWNHKSLRARAEEFSEEVFHQKIQDCIRTARKAKNNGNSL